MTKIIFFSISIFLIINIELLSHDLSMWKNSGLIISNNLNYDIKYNYSLIGIDLQYCSQYFLAAGMNYQFSLNDNHKDEINSYLGVCILNLIQAQFGYRINSGEVSFRIRSDIILLGDNDGAFSKEKKWGIFKEGIALSLFYEKLYSAKDRHLVGIGIGLTL